MPGISGDELSANTVGRIFVLYNLHFLIWGSNVYFGDGMRILTQNCTGASTATAGLPIDKNASIIDNFSVS